MKIIDTHCHLNDVSYAEDLQEVLEKSQKVGVRVCFNTADSLPSFEKILSLAKAYPGFFFSVLGIHPEFAKEKDSYFDEAFLFIKQHRNAIKAIGEIGLDYHFDRSEETKERQKEVFIRQLRLAKELSLPVVIHSRDADKDTYDIIRQERPPVLDLHCYSGSCEMMENYLRLGLDFHIGIGGVLTFKNARVLKEVVLKAPLSILLTETDSPYLTPTPYRGKRNDPSYLPLVLKEISSLKGLDEEDCAERLFENAEKFYGIEN